MRKAWAILRGNKTIICAIAIIILQEIPETTAITALIKILTLLGGSALALHAKNGYFSTKK